MRGRRRIAAVVGLAGSVGLGFVAASPAAGQFAADNILLSSWLDLSQFGASSGNDCWGYTSPSGREYALMGVRTALAVVEVTDPSNPVIVDLVGHSNSLWGDVKVFGDFCYVSNETGGGIDVIDLGDVDNGIVDLVGQLTANGVSASHNLAIDTDSGFLYLCGSNINGGRLVAFDLSNPANPTFAGQISSVQGVTVHDAQIVTYISGPNAGKQIAFCCNEGTGLDIYDVTTKSNMFRLSRSTYPNLSYCHQGWLSEDRNYFYINDETDGVNETLIFDVSDLSNPVLVNTYTSGLAATDHNLYVHDGFIYEAEYHAGLRIFDASDPLNPVEVAWFDTYPQDNGGGFDGAWSVYPFFPSGTIIVSDFNRGLFVLRVGTPQLTFGYPNGRPPLLSPSGDSIVVEIVEAQAGALIGGTEMLHYDAGGGFVTVPLVAVPGPNHLYDAVFPAIECGTTVSYYVSAEDSDGFTIRDPLDAPSTTYQATVGTGLTLSMEDTFETNNRWTVGGIDDDATTGVWTRVDPIGTAAQPEDDHTKLGTVCFVTGQGSPGGGLGENDVDGGQTTLTSPTFDFDGAEHAIVSYWRWYSNNTGGSPNADVFVVDISNDNGVNWTNVETIGPAGPGTSGGWIFHGLDVADFVTPTALMRIRFIASDLGSGSLVEAAVDDVQANVVSCGPLCPEDIAPPGGDGVVNVLDLIELLLCFGQPTDPPCDAADVNEDGAVNVLDLIQLLLVFGQLCG